VTDVIAELHDAYRHHTEIAAAIAETLAAIEQNPLARLRAACAVFDAGGDPDATELAKALEAACVGLGVE
jgi:hypothetical protein